VDLAAKQPTLAVLDAEGNVAETLPLVPKNEKLNPRELGVWLEKWKPPQRDSVKLLAAAMEAAKAEDKRVFLILSASWCGPCRSLSRFLANHRDEFAKHFVFVKLDVSRDANAEEIQQRFPDSDRQGIPWFCILTPDGKVVADSNAPKLTSDQEATNIGFPSSLAETEHLLNMLKQGTPKLTSEQFEGYKRELLKQNER
jgi:thiol-disulfide isomerase/thioredoxin